MKAWFEDVCDNVKVVLHWLASRPGVLLSALGAFAGAMAVLYSKRNQVDRLKDALEVQKVRADIARAQALADELEKKAGAHDVRVEALRQQVIDSQRHVLELATTADLTGVPDAEIAQRFTDSGF